MTGIGYPFTDFPIGSEVVSFGFRKYRRSRSRSRFSPVVSTMLTTKTKNDCDAEKIKRCSHEIGLSAAMLTKAEKKE